MIWRLDVMESYEPKSKSKQAPGVSQITNGYGADCVAGASAGAAFLKQMIADRAFYRLSLRVNELIRSGKPIGGFKVGFFTEIARTAGGATALSELYALDIGEHHRVSRAADEAVHRHRYRLPYPHRSLRT